MDTADPTIDILNSWKEIASYLGRGVRTVQRWEREVGLPVRRPRAKMRSAVMATRQELQAWIRNRATKEQYSANELAIDPAIDSPGESILSFREGVVQSCCLWSQTHQSRSLVNIEFFENPAAMCFRGLDADVEQGCNFF